MRLGLMVLLLTVAAFGAVMADTYPLEVLPPEHKVVRDALTGAELLFATTHPAVDHNLYFHERSFLSDDSAVLFYSSRAKGGLMAYLFATGELVRITTPQGNIGGVTAAKEGNRVYGVRGREVVELTLKVEPSADAAHAPSRVTATERVIARVPEEMSTITALNENSDGTLLAAGADWRDTGERGIATINVQTGEVRRVCLVNHSGHIQFSRESPYLISFAAGPDRLAVVDVRDGKARTIYHQEPGELVTHECWWINDTLTFCGGQHSGESHVKAIDPATGRVWIVGPGAWVPWIKWDQGDGKDVLDRWNWWHAAGYEGGKWIVADNWYGDVVVFEAETTRLHRLTLGHRKYGGGTHPEPGWDRSGRRVVFTSQMLGQCDVCVVTIPDGWQEDKAEEGYMLSGYSREWTDEGEESSGAGGGVQ